MTRGSYEVEHNCPVDPNITYLLVPFGYPLSCSKCGEIINAAIDSGKKRPYETLSSALKNLRRKKTKPL